jgi:hypothetical protein
MRSPSAETVKSERRHIRKVRKANDEQSYDLIAADIYSLGIVLFLVLTYDFDDVFYERLYVPRNFILRIPKKLSPESKKTDFFWK